MGPLAAGALSGAVATLALNATTYLDMAVRGRPPSSVPDDSVAKLADDVGLDLSGGGDERTARHRRAGIGALLGYATGVGVGVGYGLVRPRVPGSTWAVPGLGAGAVAMIAANAGAVSVGATDPRRWGLSGWIADIVPHAAFGLTLAAVFDRAHETSRRDHPRP